MLRKETVETATLELLKDLMRDEKLADFFLVGGTALSLQIGHRKSIDIDLFSIDLFDPVNLLGHLESQYGFQQSYLKGHTIKGEINGVKVDFITHSYPLVSDLVFDEEIRFAGLRDITAMKLNAITGNSTRLKDFIDVAFLSSFLSLDDMIAAYEMKYSYRNPVMIIKSLAYHADVDFSEPVQMMNGEYNWGAIEKRFKDMEASPERIFEKGTLN